ncbi:MAG: NUDIX hydrolase [Methylovirgula sp.]
MSDTPTRIETIASINYRFRDDAVWPFARDRAADIDAHWAKRVAQNPHLFNGRVLLMHQPAQADAGRLEGTCFAADYKAFVAWRDFGFPDLSVANVFAMAALHTADGAFLLGEMGPHTAAAGRIYFPAGTPDLGDLKDGHVDLEGSVWRELKEETGLSAADVTHDAGWSVVFHGAYIACMKMMRIEASAADVIAKVDDFLKLETRPELARLAPIFSADDFTDQIPAFVQAYMRHVWASEA